MELRRYPDAPLLQDGEVTQAFACTALFLGRKAGFHFPLPSCLQEPAIGGGNIPPVPGPVDRLRKKKRCLDAFGEIDQASVKSDVPAEERPDDLERARRSSDRQFGVERDCSVRHVLTPASSLS